MYFDTFHHCNQPIGILTLNRCKKCSCKLLSHNWTKQQCVVPNAERTGWLVQTGWCVLWIARSRAVLPACPVSQCARSRASLWKKLQRLLPEPRREEPSAKNHRLRREFSRTRSDCRYSCRGRPCQSRDLWPPRSGSIDGEIFGVWKVWKS